MKLLLIVQLSLCTALRLPSRTPDSIVDPKNVILFSTWRIPDNPQLANDRQAKWDKAILGAVQSETNCYARAHGYTNYVDQVVLPKNKSLAFSHYVKLAGYRQIMYRPNHVQDEWVMWMDADVRITNFDFKIEDLISQADPDTHVIITPQNQYCELINNIFLVRNSKWGRRFMHVWDTLYQKSQCDRHDQCPMKLSLIQLKRDFEDKSKLSEEDLAWPDHNGNAKVDASLLSLTQADIMGAHSSTMKGFYYHQLERRHGVTCAATSRSDEAFGRLFQFGPIFMVPAWTGKHLSIEPADKLHEHIQEGKPLPFSVHAKYFRAMCFYHGQDHSPYKYKEDEQKALAMKYQQEHMATINKVCKAEEIEMMVPHMVPRPEGRVPRGAEFQTQMWSLPCWAAWRNIAERDLNLVKFQSER